MAALSILDEWGKYSSFISVCVRLLIQDSFFGRGKGGGSRNSVVVIRNSVLGDRGKGEGGQVFVIRKKRTRNEYLTLSPFPNGSTHLERGELAGGIKVTFCAFSTERMGGFGIEDWWLRIVD
jgi:hypothetical protein